MKGQLTKARIRAQKHCSCGLCKPHQPGWEDKKTARDLRLAVRDEQQLRECGAR